MIRHKTITLTSNGEKEIISTTKTAEIIEVRLYAEPSTSQIANDFPLCDVPFRLTIKANGIPVIVFESDDKPLAYRKLHFPEKFTGTLTAELTASADITAKVETIIKE
ncbi:hypothetical protein [Desulfurobacterium atlanticum]|uniref:Uncharacterized protein n=1 Tax=Desulfurobacterium atlanticum TaxID=240169 RepID=A0A238ZL43_9BACT|nr:hypothetical protein [Desulfurobacterium atlanticum]SNR83393.1 hypothetical protein SAMN06265340_10922 [Desulfurobacterium atlanticum]